MRQDRYALTAYTVVALVTIAQGANVQSRTAALAARAARADVCAGMCADMCASMCVVLCAAVQTCVGMCIDMRINRERPCKNRFDRCTVALTLLIADCCSLLHRLPHGLLHCSTDWSTGCGTACCIDAVPARLTACKAYGACGSRELRHNYRGHNHIDHNYKAMTMDAITIEAITTETTTIETITIEATTI